MTAPVILGALVTPGPARLAIVRCAAGLAWVRVARVTRARVVRTGRRVRRLYLAWPGADHPVVRVPPVRGQAWRVVAERVGP